MFLLYSLYYTKDVYIIYEKLHELYWKSPFVPLSLLLLKILVLCIVLFCNYIAGLIVLASPYVVFLRIKFFNLFLFVQVIYMLFDILHCKILDEQT